MKAKKKFYVVAYDLKSDRNRNKVSKILEKYDIDKDVFVSSVTVFETEKSYATWEK